MKIYKKNAKRNRGTSVLEFVLILPLFLLLMMLVVDLGRVMMGYTAVNTALNTSARAAAVAGGTSAMCGASPCYEGAFADAYDDTAAVQESEIRLATVGSTSCTAAAPNVALKAEFKVDLLTPGLYSAIGIARAGDGFQLSTTAVSRCEVAYSVGS